jgi:hypothetical protein
MFRRPVLRTFHFAVDFLIVPYKGLYGSDYVKLLYVLTTAGVGGGGGEYV